MDRRECGSDRGELDRLGSGELKDFYSTLFVDERGIDGGADEPLVPSSGEIWRTLFYAVLALLAIERAGEDLRTPRGAA